MTMKMKNVDQTNPYTNEAFGQSFHGPWPVTDGGQPRPEKHENTPTDTTTDAQADTPTEEQTMADVEHEASTEGASRTFQRGEEDSEESEDEDVARQ